MQGAGQCRRPRRLRILRQARLTAVADSSHVYGRLPSPAWGAPDGIRATPRRAFPVARCRKDKGVAGSQRNRGFNAADVP